MNILLFSIPATLAAPEKFYRYTSRLLPKIYFLCSILFLLGMVGALVLAPPDFEQGDSFRIMYLHVPSAFLSLSIYTAMAGAAAIYFIWRVKLADVFAQCCASIGACFTALALLTGMIWGKPTWGTFWIWDARLTAELVQLFLYLGYWMIRQIVPDPLQAAKRSGILVLVGVVNLPIIHYSVVWWNTLHQGASLSLMNKPTIEASMLYPLLCMIAAFFLYFIVIVLLRMRIEILWRERRSQWVQALVRQRVLI